MVEVAKKQNNNLMNVPVRLYVTVSCVALRSRGQTSLSILHIENIAGVTRSVKKRLP